MKMTIGNKILLAVGALIFTVLGFQTLSSIHLVSKELEHGITEKIEANSRANVDALNDLLEGTAADLTVIGAHKAIENYLTFRVFGDDEGMTENLSELELFLARVYKAKPRYKRIQFVDRDGVALDMLDGKRVEKHGSFDAVEAFSRVEKALASDKPPIFHHLPPNSDALAMASVVAIVAEGKVEGLIRLLQPIENKLSTLFSQIGKNGLSVVVSQENGDIVAKSDTLERGSNRLWQETLQGWVRS